MDCPRLRFSCQIASDASDGSNVPVAHVHAHRLVLRSHRSNNSSTCTTWRPPQDSPVQPLLSGGKIKASSPRRGRGMLLSTVLFGRLFFILKSADSTATATHSDEQLLPHCLFQPVGVGAAARSGNALFIIVVHSRHALRTLKSVTDVSELPPRVLSKRGLVRAVRFIKKQKTKKQQG